MSTKFCDLFTRLEFGVFRADGGYSSLLRRISTDLTDSLIEQNKKCFKHFLKVTDRSSIIKPPPRDKKRLFPHWPHANCAGVSC